ncbi:MAG: creatininase family protein, partial [Candidatus Binatia bacterium]
MADDWREGLRRLADRVRGLPDALRQAAREKNAPLGVVAGEVRRFVLTGVGSSAAHARFLAYLLEEYLGVAARFLPLSSFAGAEQPVGPRDVLVVFSQGLSPNARLALAEPGAWKRVVLVTAAREGLDRLEARGVVIRRIPGENEFGTLVRITGPMCGYWEALRIARDLAVESRLSHSLPDVGVERVCERIARAAEGAAPATADLGWLDGEIAFVTSGGYGALVGNLGYKILEGMLRPLPPVWDLLDVAHGPFQQAFLARAAFLALARAGASREAELLGRLRAMLEPDRHRLIVLEARLPGPFAVFEHEAMLNAILLRFVEERRIDQVNWPGRGDDEPLYGIARIAEPPPRLARLTWPEVERRLAEGRRTAVVPLGSTEQHGPHLPFATDSWIAEALAERFCDRVPEAIGVPVVSVGCSPEHMDFPGTLSLRASTLEAVLLDVLQSLRRHGFERAFVFSAHGGNFEALGGSLSRLREALSPMSVVAFTDLAGLTARLHRESRA